MLTKLLGQVRPEPLTGGGSIHDGNNQEGDGAGG